MFYSVHWVLVLQDVVNHCPALIYCFLVLLVALLGPSLALVFFFHQK